MTQQLGPPNQQMQSRQGGQMQMGQGGQMQMGQSRMQSGGTIPQQYRTSLNSVAQAIQVCGWCADQCIQMADPNMVECIRLCEDVVELGEAVLATVPRSSRYSDQLVQAFQQAAQECARECGRHQSSHCQECANTLPQAISATQALIGFGQQGLGQQQSGLSGPQTSRQ